MWPQTPPKNKTKNPNTNNTLIIYIYSLIQSFNLYSYTHLHSQPYTPSVTHMLSHTHTAKLGPMNSSMCIWEPLHTGKGREGVLWSWSDWCHQIPNPVIRQLSLSA